MRRLYLSAGTHAERHGITNQVLDALGRVGAVEDARQHSNKEIAVRFSIPSGGIAGLRRELSTLTLQLSEGSAADLAAAPTDEAASGWLVVTFVYDEPDLRVSAPAVPG